MENLKEEVLAVQVDVAAMDYLRRTAALSNRTFIVAIVFSFIFTSGSLLYDLSVNPEKYTRNLPFYLHLKSHFLFELTSCTLMIFQLYQYRRFAKQAYKATRFADSGQFNEAFKSMYKSSELAFAQITLSAVYGVLVFWINLSIFLAVRGRS